jgi:hypothetical protein
MFDFPAPDLDDFEIVVEEMGCEPSDDALLEAAPDCSSAHMACGTTVNMFGMLLTIETFYEIQGMEVDRCVVYMRLDEMHIGFSEEIVQLMLEDEGATLEDIRRVEEEANKEMAQMEGKDGVCRFDNTKDLIEWLDAATGIGGSYDYGASCAFVDGEWKCDASDGSPECEGELFDVSSGGW